MADGQRNPPGRLAPPQAVATPGRKTPLPGRPANPNPGRTYRDARTAHPSSFSWATVTTAQLAPTPIPPQFPPSSPPAPQLVPVAIRHALQQVISHPTIQLNHPDRALRVMHRRWKNAEVYLLFNEGSTPLNGKATLFTGFHHVQLWSPQTGAIQPIPSHVHHKHLTVTLHMAPYATRVLVVQ